MKTFKLKKHGIVVSLVAALGFGVFFSNETVHAVYNPDEEITNTSEEVRTLNAPADGEFVATDVETTEEFVEGESVEGDGVVEDAVILSEDTELLSEEAVTDEAVNNEEEQIAEDVKTVSEEVEEIEKEIIENAAEDFQKENNILYVPIVLTILVIGGIALMIKIRKNKGAN